MQRETKIIVQYEYDDPDYRILLRREMQQHVIEQNKKQKKSAERFFWENVVSKIVGVLDNISRIDGAPFEPDFDVDLGSRWKLADYLRVDAASSREFKDGLIAIVDAYLQIVMPGFDAPFKLAARTDETGMMFGAYLRDESALSSRMNLALNKQRIIGIYKYDDVDTHLNLIGETRYLALLSGNNPDYVHLIDAPVDMPVFARNMSEKLKIASGFCIPGDNFSLVVMRTLCFRRRQLGLLYAAGSLIDQSGGVLDELEYETFTAERDDVGLAESQNRYGKSDFAQALAIHYGPRKRRALTKLDRGLQDEITKRFDILRRNML